MNDYQNPLKPLQNQESIQFGISYISSLLKSKGHHTSLLVLTPQTTEDDLEEKFSSCTPRVICFTTVSSEYELAAKSAAYFKKKHPDTYLLIGGPHATLNAVEVIRDSFDTVCMGEGEYPTLELVEQLEQGKLPNKISNFWIKNVDGEIEKNSSREFNEKLDELPFPDRGMWQEWINFPKTRIPILIGRGCPFQCSYCSNHALRKTSPGKYVRFRSVENIMKEVQEVLQDYPLCDEIYFEVETFGADPETAGKLCQELEKLNSLRERKIQFGVNLRIIPKNDYTSLFQAMRKANFNQINVGLESGSEKIREKILRRHHSNDDFIKAVELAKSNGFKVYVNIIVGFPEETVEDFRQTIDCCRKCQPEWIFPYIFYPYPGTDLHRYCEEKGFLNSQLKSRGERKKAILDLPTFPRKEIQKQFNWCYYNIYKGFKSRSLLLGITARQIISSHQYLNETYRRITSYPLFKKIEQAGIKAIQNKREK